MKKNELLCSWRKAPEVIFLLLGLLFAQGDLDNILFASAVLWNYSFSPRAVWEGDLLCSILVR